MVFDYYPKNPLKLRQVNYRSVENVEEYWGLEAPIPEVVYEHALLQNVEFEWGTWGRGVRLEAGTKLTDWFLNNHISHPRLNSMKQIDFQGLKGISREATL